MFCCCITLVETGFRILPESLIQLQLEANQKFGSALNFRAASPTPLLINF